MIYKVVDKYDYAEFTCAIEAEIHAEKRARRYHLTVCVYECEEGRPDYEFSRFCGA